MAPGTPEGTAKGVEGRAEGVGGEGAPAVLQFGALAFHAASTAARSFQFTPAAVALAIKGNELASRSRVS